MAAQTKTFCLLALTIAALISSVSGILPSRALAEGATVDIDIVQGALFKAADAYDPNPAHANVGDTVIWTNRDSTLHTAVVGTPSEGPTGEFGGTFDTLELILPSRTQSYTPEQEGEFPYYCVLHPTMIGTLIVGGGGEGLAVEADKLSYEVGELVTITGSVPDVNENQPHILLSIADQDGQLLRIDPVPLDASGDFFYQFVIGGPLVQVGMKYDVTVIYAGEEAGTSFRVEGPKDTPGTCQDLKPTIKGTEGNDVINGTSGPDIIVGVGGDDTIRGFAGDDLICGGPGEDWISGGLGDDKIFGGRGSDFLFGLAGDDRMWGGTGFDRMFGGSDDDTMFGGKGRDNMKSGGGDDRLDGQEGDDIIDGLDEGSRGDPTNIEIDQLEEVYSTGDNFEIFGRIVNPQTGLDEIMVTITSPDGGSNSEVAEAEVSAFALELEVDENGPDGVHTVEIEYGDDALFAYFIVDEEDDAFFVTTDEDEYEIGEEVIIFGVAIDVELEDDVFITIRGPDGGFLAFQQLAEGDADSFEFAVDLGDDNFDGRYSVIASAGDAEGYALFDVGSTNGGGTDSNISIDIAEEYAQGETIDIEGSISDLDSGIDEVLVTITAPDGGDDSGEVTLDDDEFSLEYEIGNADGLYIVEVEYGTDSQFSYFIVDDENDSIDVSTDEFEYSPGEEVVIVGTVDADIIEPAVDEVEITVLDPNGDELLDGEEVEIDNDGDFEFDALELDDGDETHGRFAVIVSYDDLEQGWAIFEVQDSDGGNEIAAALEDTSLSPGDEVVITGSIDESDVLAGEELSIIVLDPNSDVVSDDAVEPEADGFFIYEFTLDDDATTGIYDVLLQYNGYPEKELTFTVTDIS